MYLEFRDAADLAAKCQALPVEDDEYLLICIGRNSQPDLDQIIEALSAAGIRFFGAIFPALIHGGHTVEKGAIVQAYPLIAEPAVACIKGEGAPGW